MPHLLCRRYLVTGYDERAQNLRYKMKESLIPEAGDYNTEPSCAFQSNESNRLSLRRFMRTVLLVRKKKSLFTAYICNSLLIFAQHG
ncbi:hypothetical protein ACHWQZ_G003337 [Mnemiopsis leidyi]